LKTLQKRDQIAPVSEHYQSIVSWR